MEIQYASYFKMCMNTLCTKSSENQGLKCLHNHIFVVRFISIDIAISLYNLFVSIVYIGFVYIIHYECVLHTWDTERLWQPSLDEYFIV